jgi:hypothetical protein
MTLAFRVGSTTVDIEFGDVGAAAWLAEFVTPWAHEVAPGSGAWHVRHVPSTTRYEELREQLRHHDSGEIPCYALDKGVLYLPGLTTGNGALALDAELGYGLIVEGRTIDVIADGDSPRARGGLMRVVRELLASRAMSDDTSLVDLHAAAFAVSSHAVLIVGHKTAGKTTVLTHALSSGEASLVANDRVFVRATDTSVAAVGVPTLVSIRPWTLDRYPLLRQHDQERTAMLSVEEVRAGVTVSYPRTAGGFALTPALFASRLGVTRVGDAPIAAVLFPEISNETETWSFEPLPTADAEARIRACLYGAGAARVPTVLERVDGREAPVTSRAADTIGRLIASAQLVKATLGPGAYDGSARAWFSALGLLPEDAARRA